MEVCPVCPRSQQPSFRSPLATALSSGIPSHPQSVQLNARVIWFTVIVCSFFYPFSTPGPEFQLILVPKFSEHDDGGHLAAFENPNDIIQSLRDLAEPQWNF
jgi:hypothetical protein